MGNIMEQPLLDIASATSLPLVATDGSPMTKYDEPTPEDGPTKLSILVADPMQVDPMLDSDDATAQDETMQLTGSTDSGIQQQQQLPPVTPPLMRAYLPSVVLSQAAAAISCHLHVPPPPLV